jgi:hypothetical protein
MVGSYRPILTGERRSYGGRPQAGRNPVRSSSGKVLQPIIRSQLYGGSGSFNVTRIQYGEMPIGRPEFGNQAWPQFWTRHVLDWKEAFRRLARGGKDSNSHCRSQELWMYPWRCASHGFGELFQEDSRGAPHRLNARPSTPKWPSDLFGAQTTIS